MKQFKSFGAFATHLDKLAVASREVKKHMLEQAGKEVQKTAQGIIGEYQEAVGPYPAWEELAESTQAERARLGYSENDPGYRSGAMQRSIQPHVQDTELVVGSNDQDLVWFDVGTVKQPPRPVLGPAAIHSTPRVLGMMARVTFSWLAGVGWRRSHRLK
ncbi:hypothetical protein [Burkholderia multivorans]|uniref:hypothetical protein n=1 Tax=Burkholderia multivorans TaxID=87883 RepID=UPI0009BF8BAA|nr:hypothetical protein [Burkholderia multivorans]MCA8385370.1 hypothetical protein [Burkholderia multivorans]